MYVYICFLYICVFQCLENISQSQRLKTFIATHILQMQKLRIHQMLLNPNYSKSSSITCGYSEVMHCEPEPTDLKQQESVSLLLAILMLYGSPGRFI